MGLRTLLRNLIRLLVTGLAGVFGAALVLWARANSEWTTVTFPPLMVPGSAEAVVYEVRVYGLVGISFLAGLVSALWIALALWIRAARRERRLARALERLEAQIADGHGRPQLAPVEERGEEERGLLPSGERSDEALFDELDELGGDSEHGLLSDVPRLPEGYDEPDGDEVGEEPNPEDLGGSLRRSELGDE